MAAQIEPQDTPVLAQHGGQRAPEGMVEPDRMQQDEAVPRPLDDAVQFDRFHGVPHVAAGVLRLAGSSTECRRIYMAEI